MTEPTAWEKFFDAHAEVYDQNVFTANTVFEVAFVLEELNVPAGGVILDIGCGTGRHAIALARRGFSVIGLDLSTAMLAKAAEAADKAGVVVEWKHSNAMDFSLSKQVDAVICLCEGAFGLLGEADDPIEHPLSILRNISESLKPGGKAIFTVLNGAAMLRKHDNEDVAAGRFDPVNLVESSSFAPQEGLPEIDVRERGFVATELALLFRMVGMSVLSIWGGTAGCWERKPLDLDEIELMLVAEKTP
jgi:SAM-dependent methyltransferase